MAPAQQQADLLVDQDAHPIVNEEVRSQTESQDDAALLVKETCYERFAWLTNSSAALYFVGGVRVTFSTGIAAGGNLAYW
ncbi:hypothetical protein APSETT444_002196 [Aspergillus pseudonomiae]